MAFVDGLEGGRDHKALHLAEQTGRDFQFGGYRYDALVGGWAGVDGEACHNALALKRRFDEFAARLNASIHRLQGHRLADPDVDGRYAAMALGGMVAAFAAALFVQGAPYDFEQGVDQLTILWANALGIARTATDLSTTSVTA